MPRRWPPPRWSICTLGCCAHSPDKRPATAAAVAEELRRFVATSDASVDAAAIAEVMGSLFANGAAERKRLLNEALAKQVPEGHVAVLRRSLAGPTALAALVPPSARPASAPPSLPPMGESLPPRATRSG